MKIKGMKRFLSLACAFSMLCGILLVPAGAVYADVEFQDGAYLITENGTYVLSKDGTAGTITVDAGVTEVTIIGDGAEWNSTEGDGYGAITDVGYRNLYIDCSESPGITLTLSDLFINNGYENSCAEANALNFSGSGNTLIFDGTVVIDHNSHTKKYAAIHVDSDTELTIKANPGAQVYLYKKSQGAGIGGNDTEACGEITFGEQDGDNDFNFYLIGNAMGATIGNGARSPDTPGDITFHSGIYNVVAMARGAAIGGGGGYQSGGAGTAYVTGGLLNVNVDWTGAAIGGGAGDDGKNTKDGGTLCITGGSLRTYVDVNTVDEWSSFGVTTTGVDDAVITAVKKNAAGKPVYQLVVPCDDVEGNDEYTIEVDGETYYCGPCYAYSYTYQDTDRSGGSGGLVNVTPAGVPGNWTSMGDETNFYLYVTGKNHNLEVNGTTYVAYWNETSETFTVVQGAHIDIGGDISGDIEGSEDGDAGSSEDGDAGGGESGDIGGGVDVDITFDISWYEKEMPQNSYTLYDAEDLAGLAILVNRGTNFENVTLILGEDIDLSEVSEWMPIGTAEHPFAGTFDGNGNEISGLTITSSNTADYLGLFGYNTGTVKNFTLSGAVGAKDAMVDPLGNTAGVVAYNTGTVFGIINRANIYANNQGTGGVVGLNPFGGTIENCGNTGNITGREHLGGIAGKSFGRINACYNMGTITSAQKGKLSMGGITGRAAEWGAVTDPLSTVTNCYNTGALYGETGESVAGISGGNFSKITIRNCYTVGYISDGDEWGGSPILGYLQDGVDYTGVFNNYSLNSLTTNYPESEAATGVTKTEEELKSDEIIPLLGGYFVKDAENINSGYPILYWQANKDLYNVAVSNGANEHISATMSCGSQAADGSFVTIAVEAEQGYTLTSVPTVSVNGGAVAINKINDTDYTFTMPAGDVTVAISGGSAAINTYGIYMLTVSNGTVCADKSEAHYGDLITLNVTPERGYKLADGSLNVSCANEDRATQTVTLTAVGGDAYTFVMPAYEVSVAAVFSQAYAVTVNNVGNGFLVADHSVAAAGETVSVATTAASGYVLTKLTYALAGGEPVDITAAGSFTMPSGNVTINAEFSPVYSITLNRSLDGEAVYTTAYGQITPGSPVLEGTEIALTISSKTSSVKALTVACGNNDIPVTLTEGGSTYTFIMPAGDVTVTIDHVSNTQSGVIRIEACDNGDVFANEHTAKKGDTVTLYVFPDNGYALDFLTATGVTIAEDENGTYSFVMPEGDVTIAAAFKRTVFAISIGNFDNGIIFAKTDTAQEGDTVILYVYPDDGYQLDTLTVSDSSVFANEDGTFSFAMPKTEVTVIATFEKVTVNTTGMDLASAEWDGFSVDVSWYLEDPGRATYSLSTAAEFAGMAALVNGLVNENGRVYTGDAVYSAAEWNLGNYVNSDIGVISENNQGTASYRYGITRFNGATIYLLSDLDMSGGNYMPIGGNYLMKANDTSTKVGGAFCGVLDGQGHNITITCDRYCSGNYGDGADIGLIGLIGVDGTAPEGWRPSNAGVRNLAVHGTVKGNRSVGGIVGRIGKTTGTVVIEYCANFAAITGTDAKGTGGILGAGWNDGEVRNCYNVGTVRNTGNPAVGGVVGSCELPVINCYNAGQILGIGTTASIATDNSGSSYENCYWLTSTADVGVYNKTSDQIIEKSSAEMKTAEFVALLGNAFAMDTKNINDGYPVFAWQGGTTASHVIASETYTSAGIAVTTVTDKAVSDSIAAAQKLGVDTLIIQSSPESWAVDSKVQISKSAAANIGNNALNLQINAADGTKVTLSSAALRSIALQATGSNIEVVITPKTQAEAAWEINAAALTEAALKNSVIVEVEVYSNGKAITDFNGTLTVQIPVNSYYTAGSSYSVMQVEADGTVIELTGRCVKEGGVLYVQVSATNPATFIVLQGQSQKLPFTDVDGHWAYDAIEYVYFNGLFDGVSTTLFDPDGNMTRAMLVTVLYRLEGKPAATGTSEFADVKAGRWYTDAVVWATRNDIVEGYGNGLFGTDDNITREQMATILYRYAAYKGYSTASTTSLTKYTDASAVGNWALTAVKWANAEGLITGRTTTTLVPQGTANRAEVATILMRFCENIVK